MILFLRVFFSIVLISMLSVTTWASTQQALWNIPPSVWQHPWFIATLLDAYWGFLVFFLWVAHKESSAVRSSLWLVALLLLGNIAVALYMLILLMRLNRDDSMTTLLTRAPRNL